MSFYKLEKKMVKVLITLKWNFFISKKKLVIFQHFIPHIIQSVMWSVINYIWYTLINQKTCNTLGKNGSNFIIIIYSKSINTCHLLKFCHPFIELIQQFTQISPNVTWLLSPSHFHQTEVVDRIISFVKRYCQPFWWA